MCMNVTIALRGFKVKVIGHGLRLGLWLARTYAVGLTSIFDSGQFV